MIIQNAIQTPDGTILNSTHRHDYVTYIDKLTQFEYMIDGGRDYLRCTLVEPKPTDLVLTVKNTLEEFCDKLLCGNEDEWKYMKDCTDEELEEIIDFERDALGTNKKYFLTYYNLLIANLILTKRRENG